MYSESVAPTGLYLDAVRTHEGLYVRRLADVVSLLARSRAVQLSARELRRADRAAANLTARSDGSAT